MDWWNYHIYEFSVNRKRYGNRELLDDSSVFDDKSTSLSSVLINEKDTIAYVYDFGDNWIHTIKLEKIFHIGNLTGPKCIDGKLNTPPEDCGGIPGFYNFLEVMSDKKYKEHKSTKKWYGGDYDPTFINIPEINSNLDNLDEAIKEYEDSW